MTTPRWRGECGIDAGRRGDAVARSARSSIERVMAAVAAGAGGRASRRSPRRLRAVLDLAAHAPLVHPMAQTHQAIARKVLLTEGRATRATVRTDADEVVDGEDDEEHEHRPAECEVPPALRVVGGRNAASTSRCTPSRRG